MPGYLLTVSSQVFCSHGAKAVPLAPMPRVRVGGGPAVAQGSPFAVAGCPNQIPVAPPPTTAPFPCVTAQFTVAAMRVKALGMPLLLGDSQATCLPTGAALSVTQTQARVKGI